MKTILCTQCQEDKSQKEFSPDGRKKSGWSSLCKQCQRINSFKCSRGKKNDNELLAELNCLEAKFNKVAEILTERGVTI